LGTCYGGAPYLIVAAKKPYEPGDDPPPAWALVQIGPPAAKDVADALSADPEWLVARILAETLGRIRPPAAEALTVLRTHPQSEVRAAVAKGLGGARDDRVHDGLTEALKDPDSEVREEAASALKENTPSPDRDTSRQPD
jgi:HEAT repeat protein